MTIAAHPSAEIVIASRGISKGVAQTNGLQFVGKAQANLGALQLSGQYKNITSPAARGQASAALGLVRKVGAFQLSGKATYKLRTGIKAGAFDTEALELGLGATHRRGPFEVRIGYSYSPDDLGTTRRSGYFEAIGLVDVARSTTISATIGRRERQRGANYNAFSLGLSRNLGNMFSADVRLYGTSRRDLGETYAPHLVLSLRTRISK
jgi:hypothetical protein